MKKSSKRIISMILAVIMLIGVMGFSVMADDSQYKYYAVLGDSNASGYGMDAYFENAGSTEAVKEGDLIAGSYPAIIAEELGIDYVDVQSHCAWRTNEFLHMIDPDCGIAWDSFFLRALDFVKTSTLVGKGEAIVNAVEKADFITVDFGSNDIYSYAIYETYNEFADELEGVLDDLNDIADGFENIFSDIPGAMTDITAIMQNPQLALDAIFAAADKLGFLMPLIDFFKATLDENTAEFETNIVTVVEKIRELNPDAKIIMMGVFCPISFDVRVDHKVVLDFKSSSDKRISGINDYLKNQCPVKDEYTFVDNSKTECYGIGALDVQKLLAIDENVKYSAVKMVHPNEYGHQYLADQILNALAAENVTPELTGRYSSIIKRNTLNWNEIDGAVKYNVYRSTSPDGNYRYIGSSKSDIYYDYLTLFGATYYYKICAVMDTTGTITTDFSNTVSLKAR